MIAIIILAAIGFCIALYAYFIESKMKEDANYKPACDINDRVSCSKAINSQYGTLFLISNSVWGMAYYLAVASLAYVHALSALLTLVIIGCLASLFLAYLLYFKIKTMCVICTSLYIINAALLITCLV